MYAEIKPRRDRYLSTENTCSVYPALLENANWKAGVLTLLHLDKRTNELAMVVKDIRALRDSFEPWLDEVWWKFAWTEIKNSSVKKYKSEQFRTWKDLDRETLFVYSISSFWIRLVVFLWIWIRSNCKIRS